MKTLIHSFIPLGDVCRASVCAMPNTRDSVENRNKVAALVELTSFRGVWSETMTQKNEKILSDGGGGYEGERKASSQVIQLKVKLISVV